VFDHVALNDGRRLDYRLSGPERGGVLLFHHGTPGAATAPRALEQAAHSAGLRLLTYSRAGYGGSTRQPGRAVVDVVDDVAQLLAALDVDRCLVAGWSGGGPHALACAARLPGATAALVLAGVGPFDGEGLDFLAGMGEDNVEEFGAAMAGPVAIETALAAVEPVMREASPKMFAEQFASLLPDVDLKVMEGGFGEDLAASFREAVRNGVGGWVDDDLAFVKPWGFSLDEVAVPISLWQGDEDRMVPFSHGQWLASRIPGVQAHLMSGEGHLSIGIGALDQALAELAG
jgi:pimeloyl-ACP methyl ester carboxylesterase